MKFLSHETEFYIETNERYDSHKVSKKDFYRLKLEQIEKYYLTANNLSNILNCL